MGGKCADGSVIPSAWGSAEKPDYHRSCPPHDGAGTAAPAGQYAGTAHLVSELQALVQQMAGTADVNRAAAAVVPDTPAASARRCPGDTREIKKICGVHSVTNSTNHIHYYTDFK